MKWYSYTFLTLFFSFYLCAQTTVFINEIHYKNAGSDVGEGVEIAGPAGTDLSGWSIEFYRDTGTIYSTVNLSGVIPNQLNGFGTLFFTESGIQNGPADGLALVDNLDNLKQFLSYEGTLVAVEGTAAGLTSTDINVTESDADTPIGNSLQLKGYGTTYEDFEWQGDSVANTYGAVNTNQVFIFDKELPSVTTVSIESGIANIEFSDAISGIASISVKVLTGATLTLDGVPFNQNDVYNPASPENTVDAILTGSNSDKARLVITDLAGNETVWFFDFMQ